MYVFALFPFASTGSTNGLQFVKSSNRVEVPNANLTTRSHSELAVCYVAKHVIAIALSPVEVAQERDQYRY